MLDIAQQQQQWLEERRTGIGGSDAAAVLGLDPYKTALEVYLEKRGEIQAPDLSTNRAVQWGTRLEAVVADYYADVMGITLMQPATILRHPDHEFVVGNLDRFSPERRLVLECKTAGLAFNLEGWGESGTDLVPERYLLQCMHYLLVTGYDRADIAVLIGGQDFRIYHVARDEEMIESMLPRYCEFWERVQSGDAPDLDANHRSALSFMRRRYQSTNGRAIELPEEAVSLHERLSEVKATIKRLQAEEEALKAGLLAHMEENAIGVLPDGSGYKRAVVNRAGYTVEPTSYVDFRYVKNALK